ncbi:MAG: hypothetical protein BJ554DRAFT_7507, partial [Olpidium bornovanus]
AGRAWAIRLTAALEKIGFRRLDSDHGAYIRHGDGAWNLTGVDDLILFATSGSHRMNKERPVAGVWRHGCRRAEIGPWDPFLEELGVPNNRHRSGGIYQRPRTGSRPGRYKTCHNARGLS